MGNRQAKERHMETVLKIFADLKDSDRRTKAHRDLDKSSWENRELFAFGHRLKQRGWCFHAERGGYISPDRSAIFICGHGPEEGQLVRYEDGTEREYQTLRQRFVKSGEFVEVSNGIRNGMGSV